VQIPERLVNFEVYAAGTTQFLGKATVDLPNFQAMTETLSGAGIAGEIESVVLGHFASMIAKFAFRTVTREQLLMLAPVFRAFDIRGSIQEQDSMRGAVTTQALVLDCRGQVKNLVMGRMEPGKVMGSEFDLEIHRVAIKLAGEPLIELDKLNYRFVVGGFDYLASVRRDLGGV
jgi:hypothetical protein